MEMIMIMKLTQQLLMVMGKFEPQYQPKHGQKIPFPQKEPQNTERLPNGDRHSMKISPILWKA